MRIDLTGIPMTFGAIARTFARSTEGDEGPIVIDHFHCVNNPGRPDESVEHINRHADACGCVGWCGCEWGDVEAPWDDVMLTEWDRVVADEWHDQR